VRLDVRTAAGAAASAIEVDDSVFAIEPNNGVVHQTLLAQLAARRAGSAKTKTRGEVRGSTRKTSRQKGLGKARMGSIRSPIRKGGGVVFGPVPHSFVQRLPKQMRRLAIRSVLSSRVTDQRLVVVDGLGITEPSTKAVVGLLANLGLAKSALIVTGAPDRMAHLSARNVDGARVLPADTLNVGDLLSHHTVVLTVDAVRRIEALWGGERVGSRRVHAAAEA
jgi:large subunit ribosomal protein L4